MRLPLKHLLRKLYKHFEIPYHKRLNQMEFSMLLMYVADIRNLLDDHRTIPASASPSTHIRGYQNILTIFRRERGLDSFAYEINITFILLRCRLIDDGCSPNENAKSEVALIHVNVRSANERYRESELTSRTKDKATCSI